MGIYWSSPSSQRRRLTPCRAMVTGSRRLVATDGAGDRSRAVQFSPLADALRELKRITVASGAGGVASIPPDALNTGRARSASLAGAYRVRSVPSTERTGG